MKNINKDVAVITYYGVHNHGALLQMYALNKLLKKKFNLLNTYILKFPIDYRFIDSESSSKKYNITLKSIPYFLSHFLLERGIGDTLYNVGKKIKLDSFRNNKEFKWVDVSEKNTFDSIIV